MFCQKCGAKNDEDASFCNSCGASLTLSEIQTKPPKKHGILFRAALFFVGIIVVIVVVSVITSFYSASQANQNFPLAPIPTVPNPDLYLNVSANVPSTWVQYTSIADGFSVFKPNDWTVKEVPVSEVFANSGNSVDISNFLPNWIYIYSPSGTGYVSIDSYHYSDTPDILFTDQTKTQISDNFYNEDINSISQGSVNETSIEKDSTYYMINGNPARRMILKNIEVNGHPMNGEAYIIAHGDTIYTEIYGGEVGSSQDDANTSVGIMQSLTTINLVTPSSVTNIPVSNTITDTETNMAATSGESGTNVLLETSMGDITIALDPSMPITTGNFEKLVKSGFYDGVIFHRVIPGFMIQGGDPSGTGMGGPGYTIPDEFTTHNHNLRGTVAMANAGPNTGGSQFFINLVDNTRLDTSYPVFGTVTSGMDVVDAIARVPTDSNNRPLQNVTIIHAIMVPA
jgi:peptidylprolyl isomerase